MSFLSDEEVGHYKKIMALLIHGDKAKKKKIDKVSAYAIRGIKQILPNNSDEDIAKVMMAVAYLMASIQSLPLNEAAVTLQEIFEEYMASIAILVGAYTPDPDNVPDLSIVTEKANQTPGGYTEKEWEDHLNKMYL